MVFLAILTFLTHVRTLRWEITLLVNAAWISVVFTAIVDLPTARLLFVIELILLVVLSILEHVLEKERRYVYLALGQILGYLWLL
jgi:hypothetical protein